MILRSFFFFSEYIGSLVTEAQPLSGDVRERLLGNIVGQYNQWTYANSLDDLFRLYAEDGRMEELPTFGETAFFQKIKGVVCVADYRDGVCPYCRDGNYLEKMVSAGKELSQLELSQWLLLKLHKVSFFFLLQFLVVQSQIITQTHNRERKEYSHWRIQTIAQNEFFFFFLLLLIFFYDFIYFFFFFRSTINMDLMENLRLRIGTDQTQDDHISNTQVTVMGAQVHYRDRFGRLCCTYHLSVSSCLSHDSHFLLHCLKGVLSFFNFLINFFYVLFSRFFLFHNFRERIITYFFAIMLPILNLEMF
jgi:hypothetical protein